jgi:hypothetical protein
MEEKIEITDKHLEAIRDKWNCEGMADEQIIEAMLRYEKRYTTVAGVKSVYILEQICFPDFQSYLQFYKTKPQ